MEDWYISRNGEQEGPVTQQQIKALVESGHLDPAATLCWREGMTDWIALPESDLLAPVVQAPVTVGRVMYNPYVPPKHAPKGTEVEQLEYPGFGRLAYIGWTFLITVVCYAVLFAVVFAMLKGSSDGIGLGGFVVLVIFAVAVVGSMYIGVKRVQNLGMSGWAILWSLVPFMNIWIGWRMMACPAGYEHHRTLDTAGKVVTGIFIGLIALSFVANIIAAMSQN